VYVAASAGLFHFGVACGDGQLDPDEACDDGNIVAGDGCGAHCEVEPCFVCDGDPSVCTSLDGTPCDDGNVCTAAGTCSAGVCGAGAPVADGSGCDDGDACSMEDACEAGVCAGGEPPACDVCSRCDRRLGCVGFLATGCFASAEIGRHGRLLIERGPSGGRRLRWRWATPNATHTRDDLGDPTVGTEYSFCVFDPQDLPFGARRQRRVVAEFRLPAGGDCSQDACWTSQDDGYRFRARGPGTGVRRARLSGGDARSMLLVKARDDGGPDDLPMELPAVAQLRASDGACWETTYDAFVARNGPGMFNARGGLEKPCRPRGSSSCTE
jgi:cysteine-rich repeat protein